MKKYFVLFICASLFKIGFSQKADSSLHFSAGLSFKKFAGFYSMGGVCAEVSGARMGKGQLFLGLNVTSSSLGSAFLNNGIPVIASEVYGRWAFLKQKRVQPFVMLNVGCAKAFPGSDKYNSITTSALLVSPEAGVACRISSHISAQGGLGYHLTSGNGLKGPGFIYPVCFQLRLLYSFKE
jgi:hypothetical protein